MSEEKKIELNVKSQKKRANIRCVYCGNELHDNRAVDVCDKCGVGVWGKKMFDAIIKNMNDARDNDDLCSTNMTPEFLEKEIGRIKG